MSGSEEKVYSRSDSYEREFYYDYLYTGLIGRLFKWQHKLLSPKIYENCEKVLEIGPGFEPHIKFAKLHYKEYYCLELEIDKNIDHKNYYKNNFPNIIFDTYDGKNLNFCDNFFDRVIISHVLEHVPDFENFLNEMLRVVKPGCVISISSPCDNGFLWRFGRYLLKKTYHKKKGIAEVDYNYVIAKEHVNTIFQIKSVLKKKFNIKKEIYLPFGIKNFDINLLHICHILKM
jgi:phosphatidylethanolamine/phosphatidyl-N-methylethanolamine N-methyltransferase